MFNLRSPDAKGAMANLKVRQAFEYGINKVAVQKAYGGPNVAQIINTVIPPGNVGFVSNNPYPDNNGNGNVATCKSMLSQAGYPHGVTLTGLYINDSVNTQVFEAIQASLKNCGINLSSKPEPASSYFTDLGNAPVNNKPGQWDVATSAGWFPDWWGNNGRTIVPPFFQTNCVVNTINYGCYSSSKMDSLIKQAEAAPSVSAAGIAVGPGRQPRHAGLGHRPAAEPEYSVLLQHPGAQRGLVGHRQPAQHRGSRHHQSLAQPEHP